jgi:site-specific DNA-adenine methylase
MQVGGTPKGRAARFASVLWKPVPAPEAEARRACRSRPILDELHDRLAGVVIARLPWSDFIARYDRPATLFYLDPPYWGSEMDYGDGLFDRAEYQQMAEVLSGSKRRICFGYSRNLCGNAPPRAQPLSAAHQH